LGGEKEGVEWVVREVVGAGGRNEPSLVCTYEKKKKKPKQKVRNGEYYICRQMDIHLQLLQKKIYDSIDSVGEL
jgi:hypothetical protein